MVKIIANHEFAKDILTGFTSKQKFIPDRDYYDEKGSRYFQQLMAHQDYYPTKCEHEIFQENKQEICQLFNDEAFQIIEFGAGDGYKTKLLLKECIDQNKIFEYIPIDISQKYLQDLEASLKKDIPDLTVRTLYADFFDALKLLKQTQIPRLYLFIGNSLGGLSFTERKDFMKMLSENTNTGDLLLLGLDLKKETSLLNKAYHDTCIEWCQYLLSRVNTELGGNLNLSNFKYYTGYDETNGEFQWFFICTKQQNVFIKRIDLTVQFKENEKIFIGRSKKFDNDDIDTLANKNGFQIIKNFFDQKHFFTDVILRKA